jgi:uracil-DNA glycosylase
MTHSLPANWLALLDANAKSQLDRAINAAENELALGKHVFPARENWFAAFNHVAPNDVRAVILGQDPYPTAGNAMGLAFSVPRGVKVPASLKNIYKGLQNDLGIKPVTHGDLSVWAAQGVLLLNTVLTVEESKPNAHADFGWRQMTDAVIAAIGASSESPKAFLLWGAQAQQKAPMINATRHLMLTAPHPSPLSARRGFFDCKHFSKTNTFLAANGQATIDWQLPTL